MLLADAICKLFRIDFIQIEKLIRCYHEASLEIGIECFPPIFLRVFRLYLHGAENVREGLKLFMNDGKG
jgi:hypothetical protein